MKRSLLFTALAALTIAPSSDAMLRKIAQRLKLVPCRTTANTAALISPLKDVAIKAKGIATGFVCSFGVAEFTGGPIGLAAYSAVVVAAAAYKKHNTPTQATK